MRMSGDKDSQKNEGTPYFTSDGQTTQRYTSMPCLLNPFQAPLT